MADYEDRDDLIEQENEQQDEQQDDVVKLSKSEYERIRQSQAKANKEAQQRRHALKQWDELGVDPDTVRELLEQKREREMRSAEEKGEWQKLRDQLVRQNEEKLRSKDDEVMTMRKTLENYLVDNAAISAIAEFDGVPELLLPHVKSSIRLVEDGGKYVTQIVDSDGSPRINSDGEFMSIKEFVSEMKTHPVLGMGFKAPKTSGAGANPNAAGDRSRKVPQSKSKAEMSDAERQAFIAEHGFAAYKKLR